MGFALIGGIVVAILIILGVFKAIERFVYKYPLCSIFRVKESYQ